MTTVNISPNMNLPVPIPGQTPGPEWANDIVACLSAIDSHNHSPTQGVQVMPDGININADLPMNGNNLTTANSVGFDSLSAALTTLLQTLQVVGVDLYYVDGAGNSVRITQGGSVTGASGTITGLPSGTASASFSGGTFTFQSSTNTPATMAVGPLVIGAQVASPKTVTLGTNSLQPANYSLTFPTAAPAANQILVSDASGNFSWSAGAGLIPVGSVIATFPNLAGAYSTSATTTADAYGFVKCNGQTLADATSPMNGEVIPNINNSIFLQGSTTAGSSGGAATSSGVGAHTHTFVSDAAFATSVHSHQMSHTHQWGFYSGTSLGALYGLSASDASVTTISTSNVRIYQGTTFGVTAGGTGITFLLRDSGSDYGTYTTGVLSGPSGSGSGAFTGTPSASVQASGTTVSTGTAFSILPPYISAVYLMRVK